MATNLTAFLPDVTPSVPGCPESSMIDAIRNACIRFCEDTWLVKETLPAATIQVGVDDYTITASTGNESVGLVSFLHDKLELPKKTKEELDIIDSGWRTADPGVAFFVMSPEPDRILLNRVPAEAITDGMIVEIATKPSNTTLTVDDILYKDWRDAIKYGALKELKEIPDKGWTDAQQAMAYGHEFIFQIQRGKARAQMGNMKKSTTAKMRSW